MTDQNGCILSIEVKVNDEMYVLDNIYNPNIGSEQLTTLSLSFEYFFRKYPWYQ